MKDTALASILSIAQQDERVVFIAQDVPFAEMASRFPGRHIHEGIDEAHCASLAAAMALDGYVPYILGTASFVARRCYEQLMMDVCLHEAPVRIIGVAAGSFYAHWGPTHLALNDIALMRTLPGMTVVAPSCASELSGLFSAVHALPGPAYVRVTKGCQSLLSFEQRHRELPSCQVVCEGSQVMLVTTGASLQSACDAARLLKRQGIAAGVVHVPVLAPFAASIFLETVRNVPVLVTVEDHYVQGGLGTLVAEALMEHPGHRPVLFARLGAQQSFIRHYGTQDEHWELHGIDAPGIVRCVTMLSERLELR